MNPTQKIIDAGLTTRPEVGNDIYRMFDDGSCEIEVGEFLYGLTRILKPKKILETGTYHGVASAYLGLAIKENFENGGMGGVLDTVEFAGDHWKTASDLWEKLGITAFIKLSKMKVEDFTPTGKYDLIFLDTEPSLRFKEFERLYPYLNPGGYIIIHDLHGHMSQLDNKELGFAWPYGKLPQKMIDLVQDGEIRPFHFETQRGITCFYKIKGEDHKWQ
jgi:predicted O-methyltransferase YrrM